MVLSQKIVCLFFVVVVIVVLYINHIYIFRNFGFLWVFCYSVISVFKYYKYKVFFFLWFSQFGGNKRHVRCKVFFFYFLSIDQNRAVIVCVILFFKRTRHSISFSFKLMIDDNEQRLSLSHTPQCVLSCK